MLGRGRAMIQFEIDNITDTGFIATAAGSSLASYKLYTNLKACGFNFTASREFVDMGFGRSKRDILRVSCNVKLGGRIIPTTFVVFPEARKAATLLGVDFIVSANIALSFGDMTWYFNDDRTKKYDMLREAENGSNEVTIGYLKIG